MNGRASDHQPSYMILEHEERIRRMVAKEVDRRLTYALCWLTAIGAFVYWWRV